MRAALVLMLSLAGCAQVPTRTALGTYTRTEDFEPAKLEWLRRNCDLAGAPIGAGDYGNNGDLGNLQLFLGSRISRYNALHLTLLFACDRETPWERTDGEWLQANVAAGAELGCDDSHQELANISEERRKSDFSILAPGDGPAPSPTQFVQYRVRPVVVVPPGVEAEASGHGVIAGPRRAFTVSKQVRCSYFSSALLQLRPGGLARVRSISALGDAGGPRWLEWDIELMRIGGPELREEHLGLRPR